MLFRPGNAHGEFCRGGCRKAFANRRAVRGAELYDLVMVLRFDRRRATRDHVFTLLSRAAQRFREDDIRERQGRPSWDSPGRIVERRPYLRAERLASPRRPEA